LSARAVRRAIHYVTVVKIIAAVQQRPWFDTMTALNLTENRETTMAYDPEFLQLVDRFIHLANDVAAEGKPGEASAAILFEAGRYNAFNFLSNDGTPEDRDRAIEFYVSEYRKALIENMDGVVGPVVRGQS